MNTKSQVHFAYIKNLAASDPTAAFYEANLMASTESDIRTREEWMKLALEIQAIINPVLKP
ncbi:MAG: hypothetical protein KGL39_52780 [Patescibacteria group bacterium]|nr:hypothetical protein [Patescibacteria group bacterium]